MEQINQSIAQFLLHIGIDKENINWSLQILLIICIALLSYITTKLFRYIIIPDQSQVGRLPVQREDDDQLLPPDSSFGLVYTASSCIQQVAPSAGIPAKSMRNLSGCLHATADQRLS